MSSLVIFLKERWAHSIFPGYEEQQRREMEKIAMFTFNRGKSALLRVLWFWHQKVALLESSAEIFPHSIKWNFSKPNLDSQHRKLSLSGQQDSIRFQNEVYFKLAEYAAFQEDVGKHIKGILKWKTIKSQKEIDAVWCDFFIFRTYTRKNIPNILFSSSEHRNPRRNG